MLQNLRLAARMLRKTPFVSAIAIASLALGIGANSAIFSLFDQMLLQPLPVPQPQQLVNLEAPGPKPGGTQCNQAGPCERVLSYPMFRDLERQQTSLTGLAGHFAYGFAISVDGEPTTVQGTFASGSYFGTLQLLPAAGRLLTPADDDGTFGNYVVVLGHDFWQDRFGSDAAVVGKTMLVNGKSFTIIGVAPKGFRGTVLGSMPAIYVPLSMRAVLENGFKERLESRRSYWVYAFGRLKPGVTLAQASASLNQLYRPILTDVEAPLQEGMSDQTMERFKARTLGVLDGRQGQSGVHTEARTPLLLLLGVTAVVLLIACANIANLLLARGAGRSAEMGVRLALGASRGQLLRLLLTESVLLALLGGAVSLLVAHWTLAGIAALMPDRASSSLRFELQPSVIVFTGVLALVTGVLFGLFPALHSTRSDLIGVIRAGAGQLTGGKAAARFRATLVTVQIALSMALLASAGLFLKSLLNVSRTDLGVRIDDMVTFSVAPDQVGMDSARVAVYLGRLEEEVAAIPGVTAVTSSLVPFVAGSNWGTGVRVQGYPEGPDVDRYTALNQVGPGYFGKMGITILAGRDIAETDVANAGKVAVVNETFAKKFGLGADPVGKFMADGDTEGALDIQIVGLIPDIKYSDVKDTIPPVFYTPWKQASRLGYMNYYVRTSLPVAQMLTAIPPVVKRVDATVPIIEIRSLPQQVRENVFLDRMISILSAAFALIATLLAAIGLYGVLAFSVTQRTREIGVRMALGADQGAVRGLVMKQVGILTAVGGVIGVAAAFGIGRAARAALYELEPHDMGVFALSVVLLAAVSLAAGFVPARRAAQVNPMAALRQD